jgi:succinate dehydrogenase/fumarate reductase flavoprotein subunit
MEGGSLFGMFGARIINKDYDDFMWKYDPTFGPISDARYTSRAFAQEVKEGRGPVYLDRTTFMYRLAGQHMLGTIYPEGSWQMENERKIAEAGFDVLTTPEPFTANAFGIVGAVKAEVDCSTALPGLFVASTAISHDPGKTKGIESARAFWSGERSARTAAAYISTQPDPSLGESEVSELLNEITRPLGAGGSYRPGEVILELQQSLFHYTVNLLKSEEAMLRALAVVRQCRQKAMQMSAADPHELATYYEASNMVMLAELHLLAAIERRESRVCHYREDYPKTDNDNWLKWINFTKGAAGEPVMAFEDIPIATYRFQPTKEA